MATQKKAIALKTKFENQSKFFKTFRAKKALTQKDLSKLTKVNVQYISNIERGACGISNKTAKALIKLGADKNSLVKAYTKDVSNLYNCLLDTV